MAATGEGYRTRISAIQDHGARAAPVGRDAASKCFSSCEERLDPAPSIHGGGVWGMHQAGNQRLEERLDPGLGSGLGFGLGFD